MARRAGVLGVHLLTRADGLLRAGTLTRDAAGAVSFVVDEAYLSAPDRPILSLSWVDVAGGDATRQRLTARGDKIGLNGHLPPWFAGLLPEGALRHLVETEMGPGDHDQFDVLTRLGSDLPGAVVVLPETATAPEVGVLRWERLDGFEAPVPDGVVKFSLAGVQLKFAASLAGDRLSAPARAGESRFILKVPSAQYPGLPEAEFTAMSLCKAAGLRTAPVRLVPVGAVEGVPPEFLAGGDHALAVERFDRVDAGRRIHMEDCAQVIGAVGERKYTMATSETILQMIVRFSSDWRGDLLEGMRRLAADVLIGNGDNHLKNWSFVFPDGVSARLSPAYDIVPTTLFLPHDQLALKFVGTRTPDRIGFHKFRRVGDYLGLGADLAEQEVRRFVEACLDIWPGMLRDMPLAPSDARRLLDRLQGCLLVREARGLAEA